MPTIRNAFLKIPLITCFVLPIFGFGQVTLNADGPGNTYELINSALAPDGNVVETPDCGHAAFGRHIDEVFDQELDMNVFRFFLHVNSDDDRCRNFDRQRNEIKSYSSSPDNLLGILGEEVEYKWKFKLDMDFQPSSSFTHLHQLKAVDGPEDSMPLITLTARKGSPDDLELRYAEALSQETLLEVPLIDFKGEWVEVVENVIYGDGTTGKYSIIITRLSDGETLMEYSNEAIRMWKMETSFIRPKWGIYRSLNDIENLRDENVLFADFSVTEKVEEQVDVVVSIKKIEDEVSVYPNPFEDVLVFQKQENEDYTHFNCLDSKGSYLFNKEISEYVEVPFLKPGVYYIVLKNKLNDNTKQIRLIKK